MQKRTLAFQFTSDAESDITVFINVDGVRGSEPFSGIEIIGLSSCLVVTRAAAIVTEVSSSMSRSASTGCEKHTFSFSKNFKAASQLSAGKLDATLEPGNPLPVNFQWQPASESNKKSQFECRAIEVSLDVFRLVSLPTGIEISLTSPPKSFGAA